MWLNRGTWQSYLDGLSRYVLLDTYGLDFFYFLRSNIGCINRDFYRSGSRTGCSTTKFCSRGFRSDFTRFNRGTSGYCNAAFLSSSLGFILSPRWYSNGYSNHFTMDLSGNDYIRIVLQKSITGVSRVVVAFQRATIWWQRRFDQTQI